MHAIRRGAVTIYPRDELTYAVVDGMAVHGGDMVLGTAGQAIARLDRRRPKTPVQGARPGSGNISPAQSAHLWPGGVIPCVMDEGFTEAAVRAMQVAMDEWNSKTVITLLERTTEPDCILFVPEPYSPFRPLCSAQLGRVGGEQRIWLLRPEGRGKRAAIHEIGHAAGLRREHQRVDRDHCVTVSQAPAQRALALCLCVRDPRGRTVRFRVRHALRPDRVDPSGNPGDVGSAVSGRHRRGGEDAREASGMNDGLDEPARLGGHRRRATRRDSSAVRLEPGQPAYPRGTLLADPGAESLLVRTLARRGLQPTHPNGRSGIHLDRRELYRAARP